MAIGFLGRRVAGERAALIAVGDRRGLPDPDHRRRRADERVAVRPAGGAVAADRLQADGRPELALGAPCWACSAAWPRSPVARRSRCWRCCCFRCCGGRAGWRAIAVALRRPGRGAHALDDPQLLDLRPAGARLDERGRGGRRRELPGDLLRAQHRRLEHPLRPALARAQRGRGDLPPVQGRRPLRARQRQALAGGGGGAASGGRWSFFQPFQTNAGRSPGWQNAGVDHVLAAAAAGGLRACSPSTGAGPRCGRSWPRS